MIDILGFSLPINEHGTSLYLFRPLEGRMFLSLMRANCKEFAELY